MRRNGASSLTGRHNSPFRQSSKLRLTASRPLEFVKKPLYPDDSEREESTAGKMPPLEDSDSAE